MQHVMGQALAGRVLKLAAVVQQGGEALRARQGEKPRLAQEKAHGGRDRPTRSLDHVGDAEVEPAGAFAVRGGNESKRAAVEKNTRWHNGPAQKALHPPVRRSL